MARSTRKSLTGTAAAAAKKVIGRRPKGEEPAAPKAAPKKAAAKKPAVKKTAAKKAAAGPAKKTAAKKTPAKSAQVTAPAKKSPAKKSPSKKAAAKTAAPAKLAAPAKKAAPAEKAAPAKKAAARSGTAKKTRRAARVTDTAMTSKGALAALPVKEGEKAWTKAELDEVLTELNEYAERLRRELHDQEEELAGLMRDAGDGAGHDQADMGATSFERDHELTVVNNAREMLSQTERALARIGDGTYGVCESCGNPIGKMRLMAFPRATLCMSCKQREERR